VYVGKYFPPEQKQQVLGIAQAVEAAMGKEIDSLDWMSAETKLKAKEKLHTMVNKIGYPDKWRDYSSLHIVRADAFGNLVRENEFEIERKMAKIGKPPDRGEWLMSPPTVNAYYDPSMNDMNFPAGILQPPFFNAKEPDEDNYGVIGSIIGHELTHGFDDEGRQFDGAGNLRDWWSKEDDQKFNERASCIVDQFDAIEVAPGVHLNGKQTLGENIADLGGLWLALLAWQDKDQRAGSETTSSDDGFTPEQRFWLAHAQAMCTQTRPEHLRTEALTDRHAPWEYRVNPVISDIPEFGKAFKCSGKAPMVNPTRCRVW
jgi:endothelin-converting enzyme/putative endopeptidase